MGNNAVAFPTGFFPVVEFVTKTIPHPHAEISYGCAHLRVCYVCLAWMDRGTKFLTIFNKGLKVLKSTK